MDVVSESIFLLPKGPTLLPLVSTWEDLPIAEEAEVVAVVIAAAVTVTMTTDTAEAADHAAVAVMAAEVADHPLLITEVVHEGTIARGQDLTHLVAIDSLFGGQSNQVQEGGYNKLT